MEIPAVHPPGRAFLRLRTLAEGTRTRRRPGGRSELGESCGPENDKALRPAETQGHPEHCGENPDLCRRE